MKLTKQESAMVKLAAAWMAPQMIKKASLQDKLAAYGIGLTKKAADIPESLKEAPKPGIAQAAKPDWTKALEQAKTLKAQDPRMYQAGVDAVKGQAGQARDPKLNFLQQYFSKNRPNRAQQAAQAGFAIGSALRGATPAPAPAAPAAQPAAQAPAGEQTPMIGMPMPENEELSSSNGSKSKYPYTYQRWLSIPSDSSPYTPVGDIMREADENKTNVRAFDKALTEELKTSPFDQAAVDRARAIQADELAKQISAPGTNQYNDALQMLIQAGKNNQAGFERGGFVPNSTEYQGFGGRKVPEGYNGPNRLNVQQSNQLNRLFPAMGDTTNSRRFAGHA